MAVGEPAALPAAAAEPMPARMKAALDAKAAAKGVYDDEGEDVPAVPKDQILAEQVEDDPDPVALGTENQVLDVEPNLLDAAQDRGSEGPGRLVIVEEQAGDEALRSDDDLAMEREAHSLLSYLGPVGGLGESDDNS